MAARLLCLPTFCLSIALLCSYATADDDGVALRFAQRGMHTSSPRQMKLGVQPQSAPAAKPPRATAIPTPLTSSSLSSLALEPKAPLPNGDVQQPPLPSEAEEPVILEPAKPSYIDEQGEVTFESTLHHQDHSGHVHGGGEGHGHDDLHDRGDSHAPAGLMADHVHDRGEIMFEYKFIQMYMDGNRFGDRRVTSRQALDVTGVAFGVTPTNMSMEMHMLHFMYGWTDDVTLYIMPMWMSNTMDHERRDGSTFRTHNDGFADMPLGAVWRVYQGCTDELILNLGMSVPTGDIDNRTAAGPEFPYPMRLGSGTFDFRPGMTYRSFYDWGTIGAQYQADLPVGENDEGYSEGDDHRLNFWATKLIGWEQRTALSFRVENRWANQFNGFDEDLGAAPTTVSTVRPEMRGGYWLNFGYGFIHKLPRGGRLNFEMTHPVYQDLNGVQLETDWQLFASWSKAF